ncbi:pyrroline-5-carboxylate reductase [Chloroflexota bacterium]
MKIAFIGGGNMGEAMLSAILGKRLSTPGDVSVSDIDESRRQSLVQEYGVSATDDNLLAIDRADIVILAIKPQNLADVMAGLNGHLNPHQLVVSIIAGARVDTLCQGLNHNNIVRCMPNTPAQIGAGMTVWTATSGVTGEQKDDVRSILGAMGKEILVDDEKYLDMATAISASGPAYFFLFVESLVEAGVNIGLPRDTAEELVLQTMLGAAYLIRQSAESPAGLRRMVTSPGGTTAEALDRFKKGEFSKLVLQAVTAAYDKAKELGDKK